MPALNAPSLSNSRSSHVLAAVKSLCLQCFPPRMDTVPYLKVRAGDLHYLHFPAGIDGLRPGEQFKQMTVRIEEVDASAPFPII